jgi:hypothetical protein
MILEGENLNLGRLFPFIKQPKEKQDSKLKVFNMKNIVFN